MVFLLDRGLDWEMGNGGWMVFGCGGDINIPK